MLLLSEMTDKCRYGPAIVPPLKPRRGRHGPVASLRRSGTPPPICQQCPAARGHHLHAPGQLSLERRELLAMHEFLPEVRTDPQGSRRRARAHLRGLG